MKKINNYKYLIEIILLFTSYYCFNNSFNILKLYTDNYNSKKVVITNIECSKNIECKLSKNNSEFIIKTIDTTDSATVNITIENNTNNIYYLDFNTYSNNKVAVTKEQLEINTNEKNNYTLKYDFLDKYVEAITTLEVLRYSKTGFENNIDDNNIDKYYMYMKETEINCSNNDSIFSLMCNQAKNNSNDKNGTFAYKEKDTNIYYYKGSVNNNLVLGNTCYKIIRTTEKNNVKLIYNGLYTESNKCVGSSKESIIGKEQYDYNKNNSKIQNKLNEWYEKNIKNTTIEKYIDKNISFCSDYETIKYNNKPTNFNISNNSILYSSLNRISKYVTNYDPKLECNKKYKYSINNNLKYPVSLITADEVILGTNHYTNFYNIDINFWTITPLFAIKEGTYLNIENINSISKTGKLEYRPSTNKLGIRPVISIIGTTQIIDGTGTKSNPYIIK